MNTALLSFLGVIAGAALQYFFTRHLENQRHQRSLRAQAYMDYMKCVSEHANLAFQPQSPKPPEIFVRTADAKSRVCLYGSTAAIQAFSVFERMGASMNTQEQRTAFSQMILTMREDSGSEAGASIDDLEMILMGNHDGKKR